MLGRVSCYRGGSQPSAKPILEFAPGLYELPVPSSASRCNVFADANGSGHVSIEFRALTAALRH